MDDYGFIVTLPEGVERQVTKEIEHLSPLAGDETRSSPSQRPVDARDSPGRYPGGSR